MGESLTFLVRKFQSIVDKGDDDAAIQDQSQRTSRMSGVAEESSIYPEETKMQYPEKI
jgi:hypothetical protein